MNGAALGGASAEARAAADACAAAALLAVDPGLGGWVRSISLDARDAWAASVRDLAQAGACRRMPPSITPERLDGELDLAAALALGRPVRRAGWLEEGGGGLAMVHAADRLSPEVAVRLRRAVDMGETALLALSDADAEPLDAGLADRLALVVDLPIGAAMPLRPPRRRTERARRRLVGVNATAEAFEAVAVAAEMLGVESPRGAAHCLRAARAAAALAGRREVDADDLRLAMRLTLAPRALRRPPLQDDAPPPPGGASPGEDAPADPPAPDAEASTQPGREETGDSPTPPAVEELVVAMLRAAALDVLETQGVGAPRAAKAGARGRYGVVRPAARGRPAGVAARRPRRGERIDLVATLRAAAPWRTLRGGADASGPPPVRLRDLRTRRRV
ncbi:MAG: magnesium chelatase ATPase subunit D, partial [Caulobacteraceae bacterium]|nr:magnesium chelatase ATPase subunit D [Caulobacter sp.]